jgi:hypothetical protein
VSAVLKLASTDGPQHDAINYSRALVDLLTMFVGDGHAESNGTAAMEAFDLLDKLLDVVQHGNEEEDEEERQAPPIVAHKTARRSRKAVR